MIESGCNNINQEIEILYQDEHLLITHKPSGLLTVPGLGPDKQDCLINRLVKIYPNARIVHRLDMSTSGIVVIALHYEAQRFINDLFANRLVEKAYTAVVGNIIKEDTGVIKYRLMSDWPNRPKQKVDDNGKEAITQYSVVSRDGANNTTRVHLFPKTGRSHQLRVHMQTLGHPILGDYFYGEDWRDKSERLLLHAHHIAFSHPVTQELVAVNCEPEF